MEGESKTIYCGVQNGQGKYCNFKGVKGLLAMRGTNENFSCSKSSLNLCSAPKPTTKVGYDNFRNYFDYTTVNNTMKTIHSMR